MMCARVLMVAAICVLPQAASGTSAFPPEARVHYDQKHRTISYLEAIDLLRFTPELRARVAADPAGAAIAFIAAYRDAFHLKQPAKELKLISVKPDELGFRHVRLAQVFRGLEVVDAQLLVHFRRDGALYLINGSYIPTPSLARIKPRIDSAAAIRAAASAVSAAPGDWSAVLKIWPSPAGAGILAYEVGANVAPDRAWRVFVDANSAQVLNKISTVYTTSGPSTR